MKKFLILFLILMFTASSAFAVCGSARKVVTTAGTAVQLSTTFTTIDSIEICAESDNTGWIAVSAGGTPVATVGATQVGTNLGAGDCYSPALEQGYNLTKIKINSTVNGDGVTYDYCSN